MATPEQAAAALRRFKFKERMARFSDEVRPVILEALREESPRGKGPKAGRLADSFRYSRRTRPNGVVIQIRNTAPYYRYVVQGTKPHEIHPRGAYPLRFFWQKAGGVVASWGWHGDKYGYVMHPGTKAHPIAKPAWRRSRPVVVRMFKEHLKIFKKEGF